MTFTHRLEEANEQPHDQEPLDVKVIRQAGIIAEQQREIGRLTAKVHQLEQCPVGYIYDRNEGVRADGAYQE